MALCYNFSRVLRIVGHDRWRALLAQRAAKPLGWLIVAVLRIYHRAARPGAVLVEQLTRVVFLDVQRQVHDNVTADLLAQPRSAARGQAPAGTHCAASRRSLAVATPEQSGAVRAAAK